MLTATGFGVRDIGRGLSWDAAWALIRHAAPDSALMWEIRPETAAWSTRAKTNTILADIWELLAQINANLVALGTGRPAKPTKPYPRPVKKDPENEKHIGSGALPPGELEKWMEEKRREHARSRAGNDNSNTDP